MCGYLITNFNISRTEFKKSLSLQEERGPDSTKIIYFKGLYFGFNRLSIIDLSKDSMQPFIYKDNVICFNGEIYNFIELKKKLSKNGFKFKTSGDTEVLIKTLDFYGIEKGLKLLRGMWSCILYNKKEKKFSISRDRLGIKPLWYFKKKDKFIYSTDIRSILNIVHKDIIINKKIVIDFCKYGFLDEDNHTFFKNIKVFPKGSFQIIKDGRVLKNKKFWKIDKVIKNKKTNLELLERTIYSTFSNHLNSDVPIAITLSGGIDSTFLASFYSKNYNTKKIKYFSLKIKSAENEYENIDKIVKDLKLDHEYVEINRNESLKNLDELIFHLGQPFRATQTFYQYLLRKKIKEQGYRVIITGDGADEIFAGYEESVKFFLADETIFNNKRKLATFSKKLSSFSNLTTKKLLDHAKLIFKTKSFDYERVPKVDKKVFKENIYKKDIGYKFLCFKDFLIFRLIKTPMPQWLRLEDGISMANSIESRVPYLDHKLVEESLSFKVETFFSLFKNKSNLRKICGNYVPNYILSTKKKYHKPGSSSTFLENPIINQIIPELLTEFSFLLSQKFIKDFNYRVIKKYPDLLFRLLVISRWKKIFNLNSFY